MKIISFFLILLIETYRLFISPFLPKACRFAPSCSLYTKEAILLHGPIKGLYLSILRFFRCNPLFEPGFDPVPTKLKDNQCQKTKV